MRVIPKKGLGVAELDCATADRMRNARTYHVSRFSRLRSRSKKPWLQSCFFGFPNREEISLAEKEGKQRERTESAKRTRRERQIIVARRRCPTTTPSSRRPSPTARRRGIWKEGTRGARARRRTTRAAPARARETQTFILHELPRIWQSRGNHTFAASLTGASRGGRVPRDAR